MTATIRAVIGLGNPGEKYARTRHNAGFWLLDRLCARHQTSLKPQVKLHGLHGQATVAGQTVHLLAPTTFMNVSGRSVRALLDYYKLAPEELLVAHDDLDLPPGVVRLKRGGGPGGHNGLKDIIRCLGPDFARLRIGIGHPGERGQVLNFVLSAPGRTEADALDEAIARSADAVEDCLRDGWDRAINRLHSKPKDT